MSGSALFDLSSRVAVVTGASSGIGKTIALALADAGAAVVLIARREPELEQLRHEIERAGGRAASLPCDLADRRALRSCAIRASDFFGAPDILVSAAGINVRKPMLEVTDEDWDATLRLNLDASFFLAQSLAPAMIARTWGRIINIASLQSVRAFADCAPYGASKGAIMQLTRAQAQAWSRHGAHVCRPQRRTARLVGCGSVPREPCIGLHNRPDDFRRRRLFGWVRAGEAVKALVYTKPSEMTYRDEPEPTLSPGEVLIRVDAVGICGSDMHAYHGRDPRRIPPLILGHELAGEILAGPGAGGRVTVNPLITCGRCEFCAQGRNNLCSNRTMIGMTRAGAFAQYVTTAATSVIDLPLGMAARAAALTEPA